MPRLEDDSLLHAHDLGGQHPSVRGRPLDFTELQAVGAVDANVCSKKVSADHHGATECPCNMLMNRMGTCEGRLQCSCVVHHFAPLTRERMLTDYAAPDNRYDVPQAELQPRDGDDRLSGLAGLLLSWNVARQTAVHHSHAQRQPRHHTSHKNSHLRSGTRTAARAQRVLERPGAPA